MATCGGGFVPCRSGPPTIIPEYMSHVHPDDLESVPRVLVGADCSQRSDQLCLSKAVSMDKHTRSPYPPSQLAVSQDPLISSKESQKARVRILTSLLSMKMRFETRLMSPTPIPVSAGSLATPKTSKRCARLR